MKVYIHGQSKEMFAERDYEVLPREGEAITIDENVFEVVAVVFNDPDQSLAANLFVVQV